MTVEYSQNALVIYKNLYFEPHETTYYQTHERVAKAISNNTDQYLTFKDMLDNQIFRPNTPCMINASYKSKTENHDNNLIACFVTGLDDNMESIMDMWADAAKIYAGAGGLGIPITNLREKNASISNGGVASGPRTYLEVIQTISETVRSGGKSRRAANLASFWYNHPDILELINSKINKDKLSAINVSVLVNDELMQAVKDEQFDKLIDLISPNKNKIIKQITVGELWNNIVNAAWECGDPGLLFFDTCNDKNPFASRGKVVCANPCLPGWAPVLTPDGYKPFLNVKNQIVLNGKTHTCSDVVKTRENAELYEVELESGISFYATSDHKVSLINGSDIEIAKLTKNHLIKMDYTPIQFEFNTIDFENGEEAQPPDSLLSLNISQQLGAVQKILKTDADENSNNLIIQNDNIKLLKEVQLILASMGTYSFFKDKYLIISDILPSYFKLTKQYNNSYSIHKEYQLIKSLKKFKSEDVYDITVPETNHFVAAGVVTHNCGEITLPPYHCCILGSINLNKILDKDNKISWNRFKKYICISTTFLDNMIDKTSYPNNKFKNSMLKSRPIGLGIMGLADIFCRMNIQYGSNESIELFKKICRCLTVTSFEHSIQRCADGEVDPLTIPKQDEKHFVSLLKYYEVSEQSIKQFKKTGIRNNHVTCLAPTGSISISAECSYAFEPLFGMIWKKKLVDNKGTMDMVNDLFMESISNLKIDRTQLIKDIIKNNGSIQNIDYIPDHVKKIFVTAHDVGWKKKIKMQEAGQRYITLAISSTCNLPNSATKDDVASALLLAWKSKLKGISVYRDGCLSSQPVNLGTKDKPITQLVPIKRPIQRFGQTIEIKTPVGRLYITGNVNKDEQLIEIFLNLGRVGRLDNLLLNTLARVISKALQNHLPSQVLVETMMGMSGDGFWFNINEDQKKPHYAKSIIDAIAITIDVCFNNQILTNTTLEICPACNKRTLNKNTGCKSGLCESCGYTSCS